MIKKTSIILSLVCSVFLISCASSKKSAVSTSRPAGLRPVYVTNTKK